MRKRFQNLNCFSLLYKPESPPLLAKYALLSATQKYNNIANGILSNRNYFTKEVKKNYLNSNLALLKPNCVKYIKVGHSKLRYFRVYMCKKIREKITMLCIHLWTGPRNARFLDVLFEIQCSRCSARLISDGGAEIILCALSPHKSPQYMKFYIMIGLLRLAIIKPYQDSFHSRFCQEISLEIQLRPR